MTTRYCAFFIVAILCLVGCDDTGKTSPSRAGDDKSELEGTWELVYFERDGKEIMLQNDTKFIAAGDTFIVKRADEVLAAGTFKLDPDKQPKTSETTYTEGRDKGKTFKAIYQVDGDTVKFCRASSSDDERPTEFKTKAEGGGFVSVYKRAEN